MAYSIGAFSEMVGIPTSTLRYYEKEVLLKPGRNENNLRVYTEVDFRWTTFLLHLKGTGMSMSELKQYTVWRAEGDATMQERMELLEKRQKLLKEDIQTWMQNLDVIEKKINFYENRLEREKYAFVLNSNQEKNSSEE